jgi:hypothetical protein
MSWVRKDDGLRLYFERKNKSYLLVDHSSVCPVGTYECIGNALGGAAPSLCTTSCSPGYLYTRCRRVAWEDMPVDWQEAFRPYVGCGTLESHRGLRRMAA